ncbi:MAG: bifunctional pantoate--beta-alanine ligase/(d)CMP kinase [Oscillatoriales cyanobacterium SM2_3_0]|nr:bifunctional pantoate--beta-alanine ligase/(d)CMP kinase [Oscillatoriales cyanobacterium SM2_3_0]
MRLFTTITALRCDLTVRKAQRPDGTVGFVPTLGNLHLGHLSLIRRAKLDNDIVVVSVFVNPLQFGPQEDFKQYPRTLEQDLKRCEETGVDVVFSPAPEILLGSSLLSSPTATPTSTLDLPTRTQVIPPQSMTDRLCGSARPGHFPGVTTIVAKLLNIVRPNRVYFGQKDAQQLAIIRRMVADLDWPVEVIACPIVRETSGLALSSRNRYLSPEQRQQAEALYRSLVRGEQIFNQGILSAAAIKQAVWSELSNVSVLKVDYVELVDPETLKPIQNIEEAGLLAVAAYIGSTRLIDNIVLRNRRPILAIDGPAGAGKSTVTRRLSEALGLMYLDTGAMYRAVTWLAMQSQVALQDEPAIAELVHQCQIDLVPQQDTLQVLINQQDVTEGIRSPEVTANVSTLAAQPAVRQALVKQQQSYGRKGGIVAEGRDIGTYVFPNAELKIFLTASVKERSQRRQMELQQQGHGPITLESIEREITLRDQKDTTRAFAPLRKAADAVEIQTDGLDIDQVTQQIIQLYRERNLDKK